MDNDNSSNASHQLVLSVLGLRMLTTWLLLLPLHYFPSNSDPFLTTIFLPIQIPHSLFKEEGYDHREALFGVPPYGGSIAQNVYYADSDLCDPNVDTTKGYPKTTDSKGKTIGWQSPYILMVDRGACTFVKKVSYARRLCGTGFDVFRCSDETYRKFLFPLLFLPCLC